MARRTASVLLLICGFAAFQAQAQESRSTETPAHISFVDGSAVLERDGRIDADLVSMPLLAGDRLRTQGGRVEVLFADASVLHLDANTVVDFQSDDVLRLLEGRIRLSIAGPARDVAYRIDAPSAWVQINDPGEYRVAIQGGSDVELAVLRGAAELVNEHGRSFIRAGERTFARAGAAPSPAYVYNSAAWDGFDQWSESRRDQRLGTSAQYLPPDVRPYAGTFDRYGDWRYEQSYGYVWYPRVHAGWRPYHYGRWASLRPYGWTWIAGDPWGWPTHHYGRWGLSAGVWFWIPGRVWGPAWVSWAYAPAYVSWCPLGWNDRPVLQIVNVNVFGGRRYSPWDGWTVVPRRHFNAGFVNVRTITSVRIDQRIQNTFVVRDAAPETRHAIGRAAPIRTAGRYAVPRGSVPGAYTSGAGTGVSRERGSGVETGGDPGGGAGRQRGLRSPRTASPASADSSVQAAPESQDHGRRAVPRERTATGGATSQGEAGRIEPREYRRAPAPRPSGEGAVTPAPDGAVRAAPRERTPSNAAPIDPYRAPGRIRSREDRAPAHSPPAVPRVNQPSGTDSGGLPPGWSRRSRMGADREPGYSPPPAADPPRPAAPDPGSYRSVPRYRQMPEADGGMRTVPRPDSPPPMPRPMPEFRRAPSGPPPGAAPPPDRRAPGDGSGAPGSRQRSGEGESNGQARRRG